jgi:hypothetical protein
MRLEASARFWTAPVLWRLRTRLVWSQSGDHTPRKVLLQKLTPGRQEALSEVANTRISARMRLMDAEVALLERLLHRCRAVPVAREP